MFGSVESQKSLLEEPKGLENILNKREMSELEMACKTQVFVELERVSLLERYLGDKSQGPSS